jgi:hypothetical protein
VAFRATPGEHVEVRTPSQQMDNRGGGAPNNVNVVVVANEQEAFDRLLRSDQAAETILVHLGRNARALRRIGAR